MAEIKEQVARQFQYLAWTHEKCDHERAEFGTRKKNHGCFLGEPYSGIICAEAQPRRVF